METDDLRTSSSFLIFISFFYLTSFVVLLQTGSQHVGGARGCLGADPAGGTRVG
jgi:hypothetical protein